MNAHRVQEGNGLTCQELFSTETGLTFKDIIILPPFSGGGGQQVTLDTTLAGNVALHLPIVSSPMDTVTEWQAALKMALHGGIGIIHFNLSPEKAAEQVERVKRARMGFIFDPVCRRPTDPISEVYCVKRERGFSTVLVTEDGTPRSRFLGMVTKGNIVLEPDKTRPLVNVMIKRDELRTYPARDVLSLATARKILRHEPAVSKLPLLNPDGSVHALITRDDVVKSSEFPNALLDANEQLRVGAAVSTHERDIARIEALLKAGVDVLVIDSAQGGTAFAVEQIREIKRRRPDLPVIAGNVVTPAQAKPLVDAGADALRVGMGSGSICTTQEMLGIGRAQLSAVYHLAQFTRRYASTVSVISDGGICRTADIVKAIACGASNVMVGRFIAGCEETPGDEDLDGLGRRWKRYRGMGSPSAMREGGKHRYGDTFTNGPQVAQGTDGWVPAQGSLDRLLPETAAALRKALEYFGCVSISDVHQKVNDGEIRFELRSPSAQEEGRPHDIHTAASPGGDRRP